ncbi:MAG: anhydro-N-acetylmuramic acid kinase [Halorhodospira sp.]
MRDAAAGLFLGLISGTSADGVDAALVDLGRDGRPRAVADRTCLPLDEDLRTAVHAAGAHTPLAEACALDRRLAEAFAEAARRLYARAPETPPIRAVGCHGQTVWHRAGDAGDGATVQLGDPNRIAALTRLPVVADFRRGDLAEGGQGAPLAPAFHAHCWHDPRRDQAVLNLGGIANLTLMPADGPVTGFDCGPANTLLDAWARRHLGTPYDNGGAWAAGGRVDHGLLARLRADPYLQAPPPKSTGPEHFSPAWLAARCQGDEAPADVQATLVELTAAAVAEALTAWGPVGCERLWVCGGGAHNPYLMARLQAWCSGMAVASTAALGVDPDDVEAAAFAWLAWARLNGVPGNLPTVTGAGRAAVLGGIYAP